MYSKEIRVEFQNLVEKGNTAEAKNLLIKKSKEYNVLAAHEMHPSFRLAYEQKSIRLAELSLKVDDIVRCEKASEQTLKKIKSLDDKILRRCQALSDYIVKTVNTCQQFIESSTDSVHYEQLLEHYDLHTNVRTYGLKIPQPRNIFDYLKNIATDRTAIVSNELSGRPETHQSFESTYPSYCPMHRLFYSLNEEIYFERIWVKLRDLTNEVIINSDIEEYRKAEFTAEMREKNLLSAKHVTNLIFEVRDTIAKRNSEYFSISHALLPSVIFHEDLKYCESNFLLSAPPPRQSDISRQDMLVGDDFPVPIFSLL
ncbi:hypothetical protein [Pseudomonas fluorescens]|uniref:hypothetical protein n=1 Tax=Pseudomonas fluorescens TaxID=294 RepID=UPI0012422E10|nr:hypothetical protein [Pseudomonas fluorescens]VVN25212.1 hypothetical protein PS639_04498 [Pseudomonas fluorescens]